MNKYIEQVDAVKAPVELKEKLKDIETVTPQKKKNTLQRITAIAACIAVVVAAFGAVGAMNGNFSSKSSDGAMNEKLELFTNTGSSAADKETNFSYSDTAQEVAKPTSNRKVIKVARLRVETKEYATFISSFNKCIEGVGGYVQESQEENLSSSSTLKNSIIVVRVPAESLEKFIESVAVLGNVTSKSISSSDITDSYTETQSKLKALQIEQETLLDLLKKGESLSDVLEIQSRLSQVRAEIETLETTLKSYNTQVEYSTVTVNLCEVERESKNEQSFFGKIKEEFSQSLYNLSYFVQEAAIGLIGGLPYLILIAIAVTVVILIIKKRKK